MESVGRKRNLERTNMHDYTYMRFLNQSNSQKQSRMGAPGAGQGQGD